MNATTRWSVFFLIGICGICNAQTETIGPLTLVPNQTVAQVFTNLIPPNPSYKELQFTGVATVPPGALSDLLIEFDYVDLMGNNVVVPAPTSTFTVMGGAPAMIDTGILTLPFCPQIVSLHLTNQDASGSISMDLQGQYRHECFPVPEPELPHSIPFLAVLFTLARRCNLLQIN